MSRAAFRESADVMGTSAGAAFGLTEVGKGFMVLAHGIKNWFKRKEKERDDKLRAEGEAKGEARGEARGEAKGRAEGEAKTNQAWTAWNTRRLEAEARGVEFTEPPPNGKP